MRLCDLAQKAIQHGRRHRVVSWSSLAFAVLGLYVAFANVGAGTTVHFIDNLWPANPRDYIVTLLYAWSPQRLGYYNLLSLVELPTAVAALALSTVGLPSPLQEVLTVGTLEYLTGYFAYRTFSRYLLSAAEPRWREWLATGAGVVLMNNFVVQTQYWWDFIPNGFVLTAFGLAFLYFTLEFTDAYGERGLIPRRPLAAMIATGLIAFSVSVPFNLSALALAILVPPVLLARARLTPRLALRMAASTVMTVGIVALVSLWWLLPSYALTQLQPAYVGSPGSVSQSLSTFSGGTSGVTLLRLLGLNFGYPFSLTGHSALTTALSVWTAPVCELLFPSLALGGLLVALPRRRPEAAYFVGLGLALGLFILGVNSPAYPVLFAALFKSAILLTVLRTPYVAFGYAFTLVWIAAICLGLDSLASRAVSVEADRPASPQSSNGLKRRDLRSRGVVLSVIPAIIALTLVIPVAFEAPAAYTGDAVPGAPYMAHQAIPAYEYAVAGFLRTHLSNQYALLYPGGFLNQNWSHGYQGYDLLPSLLPTSLLIDNYREGFVAADNPLLDQAYLILDEGATSKLDFASLLGQLAVKYVVIEGQLVPSPFFGSATPVDYDSLLAALNRTTGIALAAIVASDFIYQVGSSAPLLSLASGVVTSNNVGGVPLVPVINLTSAFCNSTLVSAPGVPLHGFYPTVSPRGCDFTVNASTASNPNASIFPTPLGPIRPPTVFTGFPFSINTSIFPYLILNFTTNNQTAISLSVVTTPYLQNSSEEELRANTFDVGAPFDNLGQGDPSLMPTYGANHFTGAGGPISLTDNLAGTVAAGRNSTVYFVLITLSPLVNGAGLPRGTPSTGWMGVEQLNISYVGLGINPFAPPTFVPQIVSLASVGKLRLDDLTSSFARSLSAPSNSSVSRPIAPTWNGSIGLSVNTTVKADWSAFQAGPPFPGGGPPTFLNGPPLSISLASRGFLSATLTASLMTAFAVGATNCSNLSSLTEAQLSSSLRYLGGAPSNVGPGDSDLFPVYGGLHFSTGGRAARFVDDLTESLGNNSHELNYLVLQLFYRTYDGSPTPPLPVQQWPGVQALTVQNLSLSNFSPPPDSTWLRNGSFLGLPSELEVSPVLALPPTAVVLPPHAPTINTEASLQFSIVSPTELDASVMVGNASRAPVLIVLHETSAPGWTLVPTTGVASWTVTTVDGALLGFLVTPKRGTGLMVLRLVFEPQTAFSAEVIGGLLGPGLIALVLLLPVSRRTRILSVEPHQDPR